MKLYHFNSELDFVLFSLIGQGGLYACPLPAKGQTHNQLFHVKEEISKVPKSSPPPFSNKAKVLIYFINQPIIYKKDHGH